VTLSIAPNVLSIALLTLVWVCIFKRRSLLQPTNLVYFAALCLPFAEVLTISAGMRLIATDWFALLLVGMILFYPSRPKATGSQMAGIVLACGLGLMPLFALPFFRPAHVRAAAISFNPAASQAGRASIDFYLTYGVEALRWMQECALLVAVVIIIRTADRWETLVRWTIAGSTINCLYALYQAGRYWWGWSELPLLPFTYGRHFGSAGYARATGFMWEPTVFGSFTALALLIVLFDLMRSVSSIRSWAVLVVHVAALMLSFSAIGIVAALLGWLVLLLMSALIRIKDISSRSPARLIRATMVACGVVGLIALSPQVRQMLVGTSSKVVVAGNDVPSSRIEREEILSRVILGKSGAIESGDQMPQREQTPLLSRFGKAGVGIGQMTYVTGGAVSLPLKVWAEQGLVGLALFLGLGATIVRHVWQVRGLTTGSGMLAPALLTSLAVVVATQAQSKINFVFFFAALLLALPRSLDGVLQKADPNVAAPLVPPVTRLQDVECGS
jgi:hypothetical protein